MARPEYDTWFRIELYLRGRWVPAPSASDHSRSADFDTEDEARSIAELRFPRNEWSWLRSPVRGQWRIRRVQGQA